MRWRRPGSCDAVRVCGSVARERQQLAQRSRRAHGTYHPPVQSLPPNQRRAVIALGVADLAILGLALALLILGQPDAAIRFALIGMLAPAVPVFAVLLVATVTVPGFLREPRAILSALLSVGALLFVVPLLVWLPFAPNRWFLNDMPIILAVPFAVGLSSFTVAAFVWLFMGSTYAWRHGHRVQAVLQALVLVGIPVWIVARALLR